MNCATDMLFGCEVNTDLGFFDTIFEAVKIGAKCTYINTNLPMRYQGHTLSYVKSSTTITGERTYLI